MGQFTQVDFLNWKAEGNLREVEILRRYHIQRREDYVKYNTVVGRVHKMVSMLAKLDQNDAYRIKVSERLLEKLSVDKAAHPGIGNLAHSVDSSARQCVASVVCPGFTTHSFDLGVIGSKVGLSQCDKLTASSFCRRRLPVVMVRLKMSETLREATTFIEQGHVRVGPHVVTDPAMLVTRNMEDFITWTKGSAIEKKVLKYNDRLDDFLLLGN